jgi:phosphoribosylformimino-5-aminoimidazole carboxamide ribotide isomerase
MIVFPAIDLRGGRCVRLRQGRAEEESVFFDDPVVAAQRWAREGAAWLHVINLDGAFQQDSPNLKVLERIIEAVEVPVQFGGGLRSLADVEQALDMGVSRAILGTVAVKAPALMAEAMARFGAERITVSVDARNGQVLTHGWRQASAISALELGLHARWLGLERLIYTDVSRDGMLTGVNVQATKDLARHTGLKVIAAGGVASLEDIRRLGGEEGVEGVIVGQALYSGTLSLSEAIEVGRGNDAG